MFWKNCITSIGFFQKFYIDTCCLGCGKVRYLPVKSRRSAIMDQLSPDSKREVDIMLPIQNSRISMMYFGKPFTETVQVDFIFYTGVLDEVEPANKMTSLFKSLIMTWPLLLMTMSMAVGAGALVWVLVSITCVIMTSIVFRKSCVYKKFKRLSLVIFKQSSPFI